MRSSNLCLFALVGFSLPITAQQYKVKRIVFKGNSPYSQEQLEKASGIKPGDQIGAKELGERAQHLMDSGAFADIEPSFDGPVQSIDVIFKIKPTVSTAMLPVSLDNFVWFPPAELQAELRKRVPLYLDRLPQAGDLQSNVLDSLQAMLNEKSVKAKVEKVDEPSTDTMPETLHYRVATPNVFLDKVRLAGLTSETAPALRKSLQNVVGKPYSEGLGFSLDDRLLKPFRDTGYLDATIQDLQRTPEQEANGKVGVIISGTVTAGNVYHVSAVTFAGAPNFSVDEYAKTATLHAGDVASQAALATSYQPVLDAYHQLGYVDARIDTQPKLDSAAHTVSYTLLLIPGEPYRVGKLHIEGLSGKPQAEVDANWKLTPGSIFNPEYIRTFLRKNTALRSLEPYTALFEAKSDPATHLVDLTVHFLKNNH